MTEREKMLAGELYDPFDPELVAARERARDLCQALNATRESQHGERRRILADLFGTGGASVWMQPPFFCDYGTRPDATFITGSDFLMDGGVTAAYWFGDPAAG